MTVSELIAKLQTYPADAEVIYRYHSDYSILESDDLDYTDAAEQKIVWRNGGYRGMYDDKQWPQGELPQFVSVVTFPGN